MKRQAGLWIDHRQAHMLIITDDGEEIGSIPSMVESQTRRASGSRHEGPFEALQVPAEDARQRANTAHLDAYYDAIIASVGKADSILIFGPGEAKEELRRRLGKTDRAGREVLVEAADKMTDRQIAAKIRKYFSGTTPAAA